MSKKLANRKETPVKKRSSEVYQQKREQVTDWYNKLVENRKKEVINPPTKLPIKLKELKTLDWYLDKIKKAV